MPRKKATASQPAGIPPGMLNGFFWRWTGLAGNKSSREVSIAPTKAASLPPSPSGGVASRKVFVHQQGGAVTKKALCGSVLVFGRHIPSDRVQRGVLQRVLAICGNSSTASTIAPAPPVEKRSRSPPRARALPASPGSTSGQIL